MLSLPVNQTPIVSVQRQSRSNSLTSAFRDNFAVTFPDQGGSFNTTTGIFVLWFHLTTALSSHEIADIHNVTFPNIFGITGEEVQKILEELARRWPVLAADAQTVGRLPRPVARGWRVCDHGYDCSGGTDGPKLVMRGRTRGRRAGNVGINKAEKIWDGTWAQLMRCPRNHQQHAQQLQMDLDQHAQQLGNGGMNVNQLVDRIMQQPIVSAVGGFFRRLSVGLMVLSSKIGIWFLQNVLPCLQKVCTISIWILFLDFCLTPATEFLEYPVLIQIRHWIHTWPGLILGISFVATLNAILDNGFVRLRSTVGHSKDRIEINGFRTLVGSAGALWLLVEYNCIDHLLEAWQIVNVTFSVDSFREGLKGLNITQFNKSNPTTTTVDAQILEAVLPMVSSALAMERPSTASGIPRMFKNTYRRIFGHM